MIIPCKNYTFNLACNTQSWGGGYTCEKFPWAYRGRIFRGCTSYGAIIPNFGKWRLWCAIKLTGCNKAHWKTGCNNVTFEDGTQSKACYSVPAMSPLPVDTGICANWDYCQISDDDCKGNKNKKHQKFGNNLFNIYICIYV